MKTGTRKKPEYTVYVIELDAAVLALKKFVKANPDHAQDPEHPPVYVGHSVHRPEKRFEQHKSGTRANRFARDYGVRLRMDLAAGLVFATRAEAEAMEAAHAESLRARGYAVWQH